MCRLVYALHYVCFAVREKFAQVSGAPEVFNSIWDLLTEERAGKMEVRLILIYQLDGIASINSKNLFSWGCRHLITSITHL